MKWYIGTKYNPERFILYKTTDDDRIVLSIYIEAYKNQVIFKTTWPTRSGQTPDVQNISGVDNVELVSEIGSRASKQIIEALLSRKVSYS